MKIEMLDPLPRAAISGDREGTEVSGLRAESFSIAIWPLSKRND
jgi:hypothetical protein